MHGVDGDMVGLDKSQLTPPPSYIGVEFELSVRPKSGRIAVKVINHLGDEVMKVFQV